MKRGLLLDKRLQRQQRQQPPPQEQRLVDTTLRCSSVSSVQGQFDDDDDDDGDDDDNIAVQEENTDVIIHEANNNDDTDQDMSQRDNDGENDDQIVAKKPRALPDWGVTRGITPTTFTAKDEEEEDEQQQSQSNFMASAAAPTFKLREGEEPMASRPTGTAISYTKSRIPKDALNNFYEKVYGMEKARIAEYYVAWSRGQHHEAQYSAVFICPQTAEVFYTGRFPIEYTKQKKKSTQAQTSQRHFYEWTVNPTTGHYSYWFRKKDDAKQGAAARAYDCFQYRKASAGLPYDYRGYEIPNRLARTFDYSDIPVDAKLKIQNLVASVHNNRASPTIPWANDDATTKSTRQSNTVTQPPTPSLQNPKAMLHELYREYWKAEIPAQQFIHWSSSSSNYHSNPTAETLHTYIFVCPRTPEIFYSGSYGDYKCSSAAEEEEESALYTYDEARGLCWYKDKTMALRAVAARAHDCFRFRSQQHQRNHALFDTSFDWMLGKDQPYLRDIKEGDIQLPAGLPLDVQQQVASALTRANQAWTDRNATQKNNSMDDQDYVHPSYAMYEVDKAKQPKNALGMIYQKSRQHLSISNENFVTWDNQGPSHARHYTSVFVCPISGEAFPAGKYGDCSAYVVKDGLYWYPKKVFAENGAAARAFDCAEFRKELEENETYSYIGGNRPYGKEERWEPDDSIPDAIARKIREVQQHGCRPHKIALVSDFFYPRLGGVENHIWSLSQELLKLGHKVIVITHAYKGYRGVHFTQGNLKVYYCPIVPMTDEDSLPTFTATFPLLRWILIREQIEIVHAHQATSTLANESVAYAGVLGLAAVYTDHSLFGLHDVAGVILNRVLTTTLATVDAAIAVSQACRNNLILRTRLDAKRVFVVPNAVDAGQFRPSAQPVETDRIVVVVVSRLAYRKGVDLLVGIIPVVCGLFHQVDFVIAGDGPKRLALQEMVEAERLQDRVQFLGAVPHNKVRDVLTQGHIFLNCSLTESFCIAILEASCSGLAVVSTNVGGIPEVLEECVRLADPNVSDMVHALNQAIVKHLESGPVDPWPRHERLAQRYAWKKVAMDTVRVYDLVRQADRKTFLERLDCYLGVGGGGITGMVVGCLAVTLELFARLVVWLQPVRNIDVLPPDQACIATFRSLGHGRL